MTEKQGTRKLENQSAGLAPQLGKEATTEPGLPVYTARGWRRRQEGLIQPFASGILTSKGGCKAYFFKK